MRKAKRYQKENKEVPFTEWMNCLDKRLRAKVQSRIDRLEDGNTSDCSILKGTGGVKETRIRTASGLRIYYAEFKDIILLLLIGGDKDSQKKDTKLATEYLNDYKQRRP